MKEIFNRSKERIIFTWKNITIEPVVLFYLLSIGMKEVIRSNLLLDKACLVKLGYNYTFCDNLTETGDSENDKEFNEVQTTVSDYERTLNLAATAPRILFALLAGTWSDQHGRKFIIAIPIFGQVILRFWNKLINIHHGSKINRKFYNAII